MEQLYVINGTQLDFTYSKRQLSWREKKDGETYIQKQAYGHT
jgi:hypothetical protein